MRRLFALLFCVVMVLMPVTALAANGNLGDYVGPEVGVCWSLLVVSLAIVQCWGFWWALSRESLI